MVVVDHGFTKELILIPTQEKGLTAEKTAQLFIEHIFKQFGIPDKLISDQEVQYNTSLCSMFNRSHHQFTSNWNRRRYYYGHGRPWSYKWSNPHTNPRKRANHKKDHPNFHWICIQTVRNSRQTPLHSFKNSARSLEFNPLCQPPTIHKQMELRSDSTKRLSYIYPYTASWILTTGHLHYQPWNSHITADPMPTENNHPSNWCMDMLHPQFPKHMRPRTSEPPKKGLTNLNTGEEKHLLHTSLQDSEWHDESNHPTRSSRKENSYGSKQRTSSFAIIKRSQPNDKDLSRSSKC